VTARADYTDWGEVRKYTDITVDGGFRRLLPEITYATHEYDDVLNQFYAKARMYDAENKRFDAVDPILDASRYEIEKYVPNSAQLAYYLYTFDNPTTLVDITGKIVIADDILIYAAGTLVVLTYAELVAWMNSPAGRKLANDITSVIVDGITFTGNIVSVTRQWVNSTRTELVEAAKVYFEKAGCDKKQGKDNKKEKSQKSGASDGEKTPESNPEDFTKLKNGQGYKDKKGNIWKKDQLHKDHWDVSDPKGKKVKEVDFDGRKIWPGGPKNKNK